jgi:hypothetical protein
MSVNRVLVFPCRFSTAVRPDSACGECDGALVVLMHVHISAALCIDMYVYESGSPPVFELLAYTEVEPASLHGSANGFIYTGSTAGGCISAT